MTPGRKPKPVELKIAEGNPGKRPLNTDEPRFAEGVIEPVVRLTGLAKKMFEHYRAAIGESRIIRQTDLGQLTTLAQVEARIFEWGKQLDEVGPLVKGDAGIESNPLARMIEAQIASQQKLRSSLGFNPCDRARLKEIATDTQDSVTAALLRRA